MRACFGLSPSSSSARHSALRCGGRYFHVLELKQRFKIFLRPGAFAFVVHADERARGDLVFADIEVVSATGFRQNERRVALVEVEDLHVGHPESLRDRWCPRNTLLPAPVGPMTRL